MGLIYKCVDGRFVMKSNNSLWKYENKNSVPKNEKNFHVQMSK
jgi:hypothetical protein